MFKNYATVALRNLVRQKWFSLLNILGLALGMAGALLIFSLVEIDLTWDNFHENSDRIIRLIEKQDFGEDELTDVAWIMPAIGPQIVEEFPEVVAQTRMMISGSMLIERGDQKIYERNGAYVDSTWFQIFSFELEAGDPNTCLTSKEAIVISRVAADKYFEADENPLGLTLLIDGSRTATITGIMAKPPQASHLDFDFLYPFHGVNLDRPEYDVDSWGGNNHACYLLLNNPIEDLTAFGEKVTELYHRHGSWEGLIFWAQHLDDMHLYSDHIEMDGLNAGATNVTAVLTLASIGLFILIIACINFMNLSTARATKRAREVGMRKVSGATRGSLILQFLGESLLIAFISMVIAGGLAHLAEPHFETLANRMIELNVFDGGFTTITLLAITLICGLLAGLYPASVLSSFTPASILRGSGNGSVSTGGTWLRRGLVVFQFAISIVLIISTGVIYNQIQYVKAQDLGFDGEQVLVLPINYNPFWESEESFRNEISSISGVVMTSSASATPGRGSGQSGMRPEGSEKSYMTEQLICDENYAETLGLTVAEGRFFSREFSGDYLTQEDSVGTVVLNEAAVRQFGWENPIGKTVRIWGNRLTVVGVIKDYHYFSLHNEISPLFMIASDDWKSYISIRFETDDVTHIVEGVEEVWNEMFPDAIFSYRFLNEQFEQRYMRDKREAQLLQTFSILAIFIACLGLLGLAAYATQRRIKEIAVRKVMGATITDILRLITKEFTVLVIVANLIAWPVAWYLMNQWLNNFAFRSPMPFWMFAVAGVGALLIALIATGSTALRASNANPSDTLRSE
jgi:putative ABC transport system permease protein